MLHCVRRSKLLVLALTMGLLACGGSSSGTTDPLGQTGTSGSVTNGSFAATINGTKWSANGAVAVSRLSTTLSIAAASPTYALSFSLPNVSTTGTIPLTNALSNSAIAVVGAANGNGWATGQRSSVGSVTITTLTSSHIAGTFTFDADPVNGGATSILQVRDGTFDVTY